MELDANREAGGVWQGKLSSLWREATPSANSGLGLLVHFGEIHAIGELQAGNLPRVKLHFQISRHECNVNRLTLGGAGAFGANAVKFQITVMGHHEFINDSVHSIFIVLGGSQTANRSKTLEPCFVSTSLVTLPA